MTQTSRPARVAILLVFMLLSAGHAAGQTSVTADHNRSEVRIEVAADGAMTITYQRPRSGLQEAGIVPGAVLFTGRIAGRNITGEARTFNKGCSPAPYPVTGTVQDGRIVLRGPGPVRSGCEIVRLDPASPHSELVFTGQVDALAAGANRSRDMPAVQTSAGLRAAILQDPRVLVAAGNRALDNMQVAPMFFPGEQLFLDTCFLLLDGGSQDDVFIERAQAASLYHYRVARALAKAGYPETVWKTPLARLTNARMDVLADRRKRRLDLLDDNSVRTPVVAYERQLVEALAGYRARHAPALPAPADLPPACGGDYVGFVRIATDPAGGAVRLIREFYFKLCGAMGIPPYSDRCDKWTAAAGGTQVPIGAYHYSARWPDGHSECDRIEVDANPDTEGQIVKIMRSGRVCSR